MFTALFVTVVVLITTLCYCPCVARTIVAPFLWLWKSSKVIKGIPYIEGDSVDGRRDMQLALHNNFNHHKNMLRLIDEEDPTYEKGRPVLQTFWRSQHVVIVNDPRLVKQVFDKARDKIPLNMILDTILHQAKSDGRRTAFLHAMAPSLRRFKDSQDKIDLFNRLRGVLDKHVQSESLMTPSDLFGSFALDFIYLVLFNVDENFMEKNLKVFKHLRSCAEFVFDNMEQSKPSIWCPSSWLDFALDLPDLVISKLMRRKGSWEFLQQHCRDLLAKMKEKHELVNNTNKPRNYAETFVPVFLDYAKKNKWTEEAMVRELAIFVLAGHETTANAMCWLLFEMVRNEGVQEKCREVVLAPKDPKRNPIVPGIQNPHSYLNRVIKESMRLNPVVSRPMLRVSDHDIIMKLPNGDRVTVPKGTGFLVNLYALHNSKWNWDNHTDFDPDRFCKSFNPDELRFAPFSSGKRSCPGEYIALQEMHLVLEVLTEYHFSFENKQLATQDRSELQRSSITMSPAGEMLMRVTKPVAPPAPN